MSTCTHQQQLADSDDDEQPPVERATSAHARAGLGVCYLHMRRWSYANRIGESALAEVAYDDIARTHVARAVETARHLLAMERRGGLVFDEPRLKARRPRSTGPPQMPPHPHSNNKLSSSQNQQPLASPDED